MLEQWAHDLASQRGLERTLVGLLFLLAYLILGACLGATHFWRTSPDMVDQQAVRRWFLALFVGTAVDLVIFVIGAVVVWFGIIYADEMGRRGIIKDKYWPLLTGALTCGTALWFNVQLLRSRLAGIGDRDAPAQDR